MSEVGYCEPDDVKQALLERSLGDSIAVEEVTSAIRSVSTWLRKHSGRHWYDSTGADSDLVATGPRTATNVVLDVPSSPHRRDRQVFRHETGVRYPVTHAGPYARIPLDYHFVESIDRLAVRDRAGGVTDWVADAEYAEGRGEDYYVREEDAEGHGRSYLYIRAASIGPRVDYGSLLELDVSYGLDAATEDWQDVRRGVALAAGAELVIEGDAVVESIPDSGTLVGVDTQRQQLLADAAAKLRPYLGAGIAVEG